MKEFDEFLEMHGLSESTRRSLESALHTLLETKKSPEELPLTTRSRSVYRRAWRLYQKFLEYKKADVGRALSVLRKKGAVSESELKKLLKNSNDFNAVMLKLIDTGSVYVVHENKKIILVEGYK